MDNETYRRGLVGIIDKKSADVAVALRRLAGLEFTVETGSARKTLVLSAPDGRRWCSNPVSRNFSVAFALWLADLQRWGDDDIGIPPFRNETELRMKLELRGNRIP